MLWKILIPLAGALTAPAAAALLRRAEAPIPVPRAAVLSALGLAAVAWRSPSWWLPVPCVLTAFAVPLALADLRHLRLPDVLTLPAYPALGAALALTSPAALPRAAAGAVLFGGLHVLIHWLAPDSLGLGDVKLSPPLGAVLAAVSWPALLLAAVAAAIFTALLALARRGRSAPHGPSLLLATWLCAIL